MKAAGFRTTEFRMLFTILTNRSKEQGPPPPEIKSIHTNNRGRNRLFSCSMYKKYSTMRFHPTEMT